MGGTRLADQCRLVPGEPLFLVRKPDRAGVPGGAVVTFENADLAGMRQRLEAAGFTVSDNSASDDPIRLLSVEDPDGNMVEISEPVQ